MTNSAKEKTLLILKTPQRLAHTLLAGEAIKIAAAKAGIQIQIETHTSNGVNGALSQEEINAAQKIIIICDTKEAASQASADAKYAGKTIQTATLDEVLQDAGKIISGGQTQTSAPEKADANTPLKIVAITSCPTGIAHTFMAEEGLKVAAQELGHQIKVETQGSVGAQNALTPEDINQADLVIIAADTKVDTSRFTGKRLFSSSTKAAIKDGKALINQAQKEATAHALLASEQSQEAKEQNEGQGATLGSQIYKHLMTGVSHMLPFVTAGGLLIALAFAFGGIYVYKEEYANTFGQILFLTGAKAAFALMIPVLSGYIAYSIANRPGLAPGMAGGMIAASINAGFLGAIVSGFIAGYAVKWLNDNIKLGRNFEGLKPVLILPVLGTLIVGLLMYYVLGHPVASVMAALTKWLQSLQGASALILGLLLGGMMAVDMGGPVNKAAYTFGTGLIASEVFAPMAAVMAGGMTPPLAIALAAFIFKDKFTPEEREGSKAAGVLGLSFITEGAIPFAAKDPVRVIPALVAGSALTGAISMVAGAELRAPHGGIFVLFIPNAISNLGMYIIALLAGTILSAVLLGVLKKKVEK